MEHDAELTILYRFVFFHSFQSLFATVYEADLLATENHLIISEKDDEKFYLT